ncbi:MAG: DUF3842 family protein [Thermoguttaceae bacterium]
MPIGVTRQTIDRRNTAGNAAGRRYGRRNEFSSYHRHAENPVIAACRKTDLIIGPIGIGPADSMFGEITPKWPGRPLGPRQKNSFRSVTATTISRASMIGIWGN